MINSSLLDKRAAAKFLGISVETLDRLDRAGRSPERYRVGSQVRYSLDRIQAWLEEQKEKDSA